MDFINYISEIIIPFIIVFIIAYGFIEKKNVYDIFITGEKRNKNSNRIMPNFTRNIFSNKFTKKFRYN